LVSQHQFFLKISYILKTGQNSQVIRSSLIVSRQRDDTCAGFLTVRKTEEIVNVWPQGILCVNHSVCLAAPSVRVWLLGLSPFISRDRGALSPGALRLASLVHLVAPQVFSARLSERREWELLLSRTVEAKLPAFPQLILLRVPNGTVIQPGAGRRKQLVRTFGLPLRLARFQ
jgi:hypothetical protein